MFRIAEETSKGNNVGCWNIAAAYLCSLHFCKESIHDMGQPLNYQVIYNVGPRS